MHVPCFFAPGLTPFARRSITSHWSKIKEGEKEAKEAWDKKKKDAEEAEKKASEAAKGDDEEEEEDDDEL